MMRGNFRVREWVNVLVNQIAADHKSALSFDEFANGATGSTGSHRCFYFTKTVMAYNLLRCFTLECRDLCLPLHDFSSKEIVRLRLIT